VIVGLGGIWGLGHRFAWERSAWRGSALDRAFDRAEAGAVTDSVGASAVEYSV
jgi:hypothetical protein